MHKTSITVIALGVVACWCLQPLIPLFHLNFAGHEHRYCREHGALEDIQPRDSTIDVGLQSIATSLVASPEATLADLHVLCTSANLLVPLALKPPFPPADSRHEQFACYQGVRDLPNLQQPALFLLAPKQSPPALPL